MLAVTMKRMGYNVAILDADVTGPSIPKAFGIKDKATGSEFGLYPLKSKTGIDIMSINLLLENDTDPVIWRGPILGNTVKQFWTDVIWGDVDFMLASSFAFLKNWLLTKKNSIRKVPKKLKRRLKNQVFNPFKNKMIKPRLKN